LAFQTGVRWNLNVILVYIFSMVKNIEHLFLYLLATCASSFENCLLSLFAHWFIKLLILSELNFWASSKFCLLILCQMCSWKIFSQPVGVSSVERLFHLWCRSFLVCYSHLFQSYLLFAELLESVIITNAYLFQCFTYSFRISVVSEFRSFIENFDPLWIDINTRWEMGLLFQFSTCGYPVVQAKILQNVLGSFVED
jgi:hypothetical protein